MIYYWILLIIIVILCYNGSQTSQRNKILFLCVSLFFVFFAFRVGFTPDYENYSDVFDQFHNSSSFDKNDEIEYGFQWLCQLLPSYRAVLVVYTALFCVCIYIAFKMYIGSKYWLLSFMILFCYPPFVLGNMSGMRSGIVTCALFIALIVKSKYNFKGLLAAIGIMLAAALFHRSSITLIPLLFITNRPFSNKVVKTLYVIASVFIVVSLFFADSLNQLAISATDFVFEDNYYQKYFESEIERGYSFFSILKTIILATLLFITLEFTKNAKDNAANIFIKLTALFYLLTLAPGTIGLITRYYYYFTFPCIIGTSYLIDNVNKKTMTIYLICVSLFAFWQLYTFLTNSVVMVYYSFYKIILF